MADQDSSAWARFVWTPDDIKVIAPGEAETQPNEPAAPAQSKPKKPAHKLLDALDEHLAKI